MKKGPAVALAGALLAAACPARSQPGEAPVHASLHVEPAAGCSGADTLAAAVEGVLGRTVFRAPNEADLRVAVRFTHASDGGWEAHVGLWEGDRVAGERVIASDEASCEALVGPTALVVALMVDAQRPRLVLRAPPPPAAPEPTAAAVPQTRWGMRSSVDLGLSYGALPGLVPGLRLGTVLSPPGAVPVEVSLTAWSSAETSEDGAGGRFRLWHGGLGVCPGWEGDATRLGVCAGVQAGQLDGAGLGLANVREPRHLWVHAEGRVDFALRLYGPFAWHLSAGAAVPFHRPDFVYSRAQGGTESVHRPLAVVPIAEIGIEANLAP